MAWQTIGSNFVWQFQQRSKSIVLQDPIKVLVDDEIDDSRKLLRNHANQSVSLRYIARSWEHVANLAGTVIINDSNLHLRLTNLKLPSKLPGNDEPTPGLVRNWEDPQKCRSKIQIHAQLLLAFIHVAPRKRIAPSHLFQTWRWYLFARAQCR